jgi:hypothetical protein
MLTLLSSDNELIKFENYVKSPVLANFVTTNGMTKAYKLNYSVETINMMIDYLNGVEVPMTDELKKLCGELGIDVGMPDNSTVVKEYLLDNHAKYIFKLLQMNESKKYITEKVNLDGKYKPVNNFNVSEIKQVIEGRKPEEGIDTEQYRQVSLYPSGLRKIEFNIGKMKLDNIIVNKYVIDKVIEMLSYMYDSLHSSRYCIHYVIEKHIDYQNNIVTLIIAFKNFDRSDGDSLI